MNQKSYIVDPYKLVVALATSIGCIALGIAVLTIQRYFSAIVFFAISALFLWVAWINGSTVTMSEEGVELKFFHKRRKFLLWSEIKEVGVAGTKVLRQKNKDDVGSLQIYFSKKAMNDDERRAMLFNWPPKDMIYMRYIEERWFALQMVYTGKITRYNNGKFHG